MTKHEIIKLAVSIVNSKPHYTQLTIEQNLGNKWFTLCDCARTGKRIGQKQIETANQIIADWG